MLLEYNQVLYLEDIRWSIIIS